MRKCDIDGCEKKHEAKGYCKNHYKSFLRHGNPLHVEENKRLQEAKKELELAKRNKIQQHSTDGICKIHGCKNPIKARLMCETHYARERRTGSTEVTRKRLKVKVEQCLVIECDKKALPSGFCSTHQSYKNKHGSPYMPKVFKLCGVEDCYEKHWGRGLCREHFLAWRKILRNHKLY